MKRNGNGTEAMEANSYLKQTVLEAVENQIRDNTPPEAAETLSRLMEAGYSRDRAKEKIAVVLVEHIYTAMRDQKPFDGDAYIRDLKKII